MLHQQQGRSVQMDESFNEQVLCKRTVHARVDEHVVSIEVSIGAPVLDPEHNSWWCSIFLPGIETYVSQSRRVWRVGGYDGFQALSLALEHIGRLLDQTGLKWTAFPEHDFDEQFSGEPDDGFWWPMTSGVPAEFGGRWSSS